jgi:hypothetical protein
MPGRAYQSAMAAAQATVRKSGGVQLAFRKWINNPGKVMAWMQRSRPTLSCCVWSWIGKEKKYGAKRKAHIELGAGGMERLSERGNMEGSCDSVAFLSSSFTDRQGRVDRGSCRYDIERLLDDGGGLVKISNFLPDKVTFCAIEDSGGREIPCGDDYDDGRWQTERLR